MRSPLQSPRDVLLLSCFRQEQTTYSRKTKPDTYKAESKYLTTWSSEDMMSHKSRQLLNFGIEMLLTCRFLQKVWGHIPVGWKKR